MNSKQMLSLVIDGDRVLPLPMTLERVEPITWRDLQVVQPRSQVDILQLTRCPLGDIRWEVLHSQKAA
jgi:hypothetical protein